MKKIKILWTGGWDSSFRMCQLSRMSVTIQPIYIRHPKRLSTDLELNAMQKIRQALIHRPETVAKILPVKVIGFEDILISQPIKDAFIKVRNLFPKIGSQYEWLAAFAQLHPGVELGEEHYRNKPGTLWSIFIAAGGLQFDSDNVGYLSTLDKDVNLILGNFSYPIASYTELEMLKIIKDWHYEDVMQHVWFCQHPVDGKPCGVCTPCQIKMKAGMEWMLPKTAKLNYQILKSLEQDAPDKTEDFKQYIYGIFSSNLAFLDNLEYIMPVSKNVLSKKCTMIKQVSFFDNMIKNYMR